MNPNPLPNANGHINAYIYRGLGCDFLTPLLEHHMAWAMYAENVRGIVFKEALFILHPQNVWVIDFEFVGSETGTAL